MGVQALFFAGVFGFVLALVWPYLDGYITGEVLPKARGYFTTKSETTRTWVYIDTTADLLTSLWWSLPLALVGPTPGEVASRPLMFPFLLSGLVVLGSWLYSVGSHSACSRVGNARFCFLGGCRLRCLFLSRMCRSVFTTPAAPFGMPRVFSCF